jgi:nucleoside-diphosphate-sugar epimerase
VTPKPRNANLGTGARRVGPQRAMEGVVKRPPLRAARSVPQLICSETELDDCLTRPRPELVRFIRQVSSPLILLGAGGKMGPTLAVLAQRAAERARHRLEVIAVSRFGEASSREWLEERGIRTISADLFQPKELRRLPDAQNLIYLVGLKFGTAQNPSLTWAVNTLVPASVMERYAGARVAALSTGNVYPMVPTRSQGARETDPLTPLGEYPNAAVARERMFDYFSRRDGSPVALLRLNYAIDLRYGVLADIAGKIIRGEPIDLATGYFNCIWQGDANDRILRSLALARSPAEPWNLTGPTACSVRTVATHLGELLDCTPKFQGRERTSALLSDTAKLDALLGPPPTTLRTMLRWTADWARGGGRVLNKPTHFEVRDGRY